MKLAGSLDAVRGAIRAAASPLSAPEQDEVRPRRVVTISRQGGVGIAAIVTELVDRLNETRVEEELPWVGYDRELVERVAEDHNLEEDLVASLDERDRSWFEHFTAGLAFRATGSDMAIKTARTIRGLARVGNAVLVGRGGQCVLADMGHAAHVRVVAPLEWRTTRIAQERGISVQEAERIARGLDRDRTNFVKVHFKRDVTDIRLYHLVVNAERMEAPVAARVIARLVEQI